MSERSGVQRAPRSGGRTAEQGSTGNNRRTPVTGGAAGGARGGRRHPTQGTSALQLDTVQPARAVEVERRPRLQVAPPAPINVPRAPFVALVIVLVIAGVFGILLINTKTNENSFQITELQKQQAALDSEQQALQQQIDFFDMPGNIQARARQLGLVKGHPAIIRLPDGKIIGTPVPGSGELSRAAQGNGTQAPAQPGHPLQADPQAPGAQAPGVQAPGAQAPGVQAPGAQGPDTGVLPGTGQ